MSDLTADEQRKLSSAITKLFARLEGIIPGVGFDTRRDLQTRTGLMLIEHKATDRNMVWKFHFDCFLKASDPELAAEAIAMKLVEQWFLKYPSKDTPGGIHG